MTRTIREATPEDVDRIVTIGAELHAEGNYKGLPFVPERAAHTMRTLIENDAGIVLVLDVDGVIVGGIAGMCVQHWFTDAKVACDVSFFILPEHRGSIAAARLLRQFVSWGKAQGAARIEIGITTDIHQERTAAFYERMGFSHKGLQFFMGVCDGD